MNNIITSKINDKLTVPSSIWKSLGLNKGDLVDFVLENDKAILKKHDKNITTDVNDTNHVSVNLTSKTENNSKEYDLIVRKRKLVRIPAEIFNKYKLQYVPYQTSLVNCNEKLEITFEKYSYGELKFRKENELSLGLIENKYNIEIPEGISLKLKSFDNNESFTLIFNSNDIIYKPKSLSDTFKRKQENNTIKYDMPPIEQHIQDKNGNKIVIHNVGIPDDNNEKELELKEESIKQINQYSNERKLKVNSRHTINIPSDIFIKMNLSNKIYLPICTSDNKNVYISLIVTDEKDKIESNMKYYKKFRNMNTLTLTEATKEFFKEPVKIGTEFTLIYNEEDKSLLFIFDRDKVKLYNEEDNNTNNITTNDNIEDNNIEKEQLKQIDKPKIILLDESKETNQKKKQIMHEINNRIKRGDSIKFISEEDLPKNETKCATCKKELTDKDKSMYRHHRVCNQCNRIHLKHFLNPIIELSKLNNTNKEGE